MDNLQQTFQTLVSKYIDQPLIIDQLWKELELAYTQNDRFYHTLDHLQSMLNELYGVKDGTKSWEPLLFALFYHDVVYNPSSKLNEEDSASLAKKRLRQIGVMPYTIGNCNEAILASTPFTTQRVE